MNVVQCHTRIVRIALNSIFYLQELKRLNLANNLIDKLVNRVFYMLLKLKYLDLSGNPLSNLPPEAFKDISVRVL